MADRIWIWFAENGNIRKWDAKPFDEGTEYIVAAHADAELEEMTRSCLAERKASAEKDARIAQLIAETHDLGNEICGLNDTVDNLNGNLDRLSESYRIIEDRAETWMRERDASRAECEGLRANLAAEERRSAELLKRLDKAREGTEPDYCYDPDEWEFTSSWDERDQVHGYGENLPIGGVMQVATLIRGPRKWVANVPVTWDENGDLDDTQIQWFDSEDAARTALSQKETGA